MALKFKVMLELDGDLYIYNKKVLAHEGCMYILHDVNVNKILFMMWCVEEI